MFDKAWRESKHLTNELEHVDVFLARSEKEVASLAFPRTDGRFDYQDSPQRIQ